MRVCVVVEEDELRFTPGASPPPPAGDTVSRLTSHASRYCVNASLISTPALVLVIGGAVEIFGSTLLCSK